MLNLLLSVFSSLVRRSSDGQDGVGPRTPSISPSGLDACAKSLDEPGAAAAFGLLLVAGWALGNVYESKSGELVILKLNDSLADDAAQQIGPERPERVSHQHWCGDD